MDSTNLSQQPKKELGNGLGIASLILGIIGFLTAFIVIGILFDIIAIILGIIAIASKKQKSGFGIAGLVIAVASIVLMVFIGSIFSDSSTSKSKPNTASVQTSDVTYISESEQQPPVTIEELELSINILSPDSTGTRYLSATYTNNSSYPITALSITVLLKDSNEKTYLSTYDTVLPGETSSIFESFGPSTGSESDIQFLNYEITVMDDDGSKTYVDYDCKLGTYSFW